MNRQFRTIDPTDRLRVESKLDRNETLVWFGRPVPTFRYRGWIGPVIFGIPWSAFSVLIVFKAIIPMWMGLAKSEDGGPIGLWTKIGLTAFMMMFVVIGIGMLFSPLWHKLDQMGRLYAVTDKRALSIGRVFTQSWRGSEMFEPDRADHRNGLSDLWFVPGGYSSKGGEKPPEGFSNLLPEDADEAELALRALKALSSSADSAIPPDTDPS